MLDDLDLVLDELLDETRPARTIDLTRLSDLPRSEMPRFAAAWRDVNPARRLELVSTMVEQAEVNIHLNFHAILRECLTDPDAGIRKLAVEGLWEDERPTLIGRLVALLAADPASDVRAAAATSLVRFVLLGALGDISEALSREAEEALKSAWFRACEVTDVRRRALESLAYASDPLIHELIDAAYADEDGLMRQSAVFAMGRSVDRRWARHVLAELSSQDPAMRFEAAGSAGELALKAAVGRLIQLLDDTDSSVREASALALGKIGGRNARRALEAARESSDERLAQAAEEALDELAFNSESLELGLVEYPAHLRAGPAYDADDADEDDMADDLCYDDEFVDLLEDDDTWGADDDEGEIDWLEEDSAWEDADDSDAM